MIFTDHAYVIVPVPYVILLLIVACISLDRDSVGVKAFTPCEHFLFQKILFQNI